MPRPKCAGWVNMSDPDIKRRFLIWAGRLTGDYELDIQPRRATRSNRQLRWWWPCVVGPFYEFLREQDWDITCADDAHDLLREKFLRVPAAHDLNTGEVLAWRTKRTKELDTAEFAEFAEKCRDWLVTQFGIVTMDPDPEWSTESEPKQAASAAGK